MPTPEGVVLAEVIAFCAKVPGLRVYRNHSGRTRQGFKYGVGPNGGGGADLLGWCKSATGYATAGIGGARTVYYTRFVAIEVKVPGEKATPAQAAFLKDVVDAGGIAGIVHSVNEVADLLGVPRP